MKKLLTIVAVFVAVCAQAQQFEVVSMQRIKAGNNAETFHPVFTPDGQSLLVTSENYNGLGLIDIKSQSFNKLTDMAGAGYKATISADGSTVIAREIHGDEQLVSLYSINVASKAVTPIAKKVEHFNTVTMENGVATYALNGATISKQVVKEAATTKAITPTRKRAFVTEEDLKLVIYRDGQRTVVDPFSTPEYDAQYCWSSLSPDGTKLLFVSRNNAFVSDLDGSNVVDLGAIHSPVWRGNDYVVAMLDKDDGHKFTSSEIVIVDVKGKVMQQLSQTSSEIKMFPSVSPDGSQIAYHTIDGNIYIMTIKQK